VLRQHRSGQAQRTAAQFFSQRRNIETSHTLRTPSLHRTRMQRSWEKEHLLEARKSATISRTSARLGEIESGFKRSEEKQQKLLTQRLEKTVAMNGRVTALSKTSRAFRTRSVIKSRQAQSVAISYDGSQGANNLEESGIATSRRPVRERTEIRHVQYSVIGRYKAAAIEEKKRKTLERLTKKEKKAEDLAQAQMTARAELRERKRLQRLEHDDNLQRVRYSLYAHQSLVLQKLKLPPRNHALVPTLAHF
jgi:hypothetical protein